MWVVVACILVSVPAVPHAFAGCVFEVVPAKEYTAVVALAEHLEDAHVDRVRLTSAARAERRQHEQLRKRMRGTVVTYGTAIQVGVTCSRVLVLQPLTTLAAWWCCGANSSCM